MSEQVLVLKRDFINKYISGRNGLITEDREGIFAEFVAHHEFLPRPVAEESPEYKQLIPYVVLCRGEQVFVTRRLNKGGEKRLHGLLSIGIGGHINPVDGEGEDVLMRALHREIDEEVEINRHSELIPRGFINDDSNAVGSVHLGACFTMEVSGEVKVRETEKLEGLWMTVSELIARKDSMETWSQIALEILK